MSLEQVQEILFDEDDEEFFFSGSDVEFCDINQHECEKDSDEENDDSFVNDFESCSMDDTSGTSGTLVIRDENYEICADDYDSCRSLLEDLLNNGGEDDMVVDIVDNVSLVDSSVGDNMDNDNMNDGMFEDTDIDESGETSMSTGRGRGVGRGRGAVSSRGVICGRGVIRGSGFGRGSGVGRGRGAGRGRGHALPECTIPWKDEGKQ